ncbi:cell division inhibitor SulA [Marinobacter mobilis]|uniref:Cell division inhibitor SulA n=1 Tax=Marinobacter mobilis TaxID=488533 RepID=A0A1H2YRY0_9GAMM|nr:SulA-like leucine-rich domain-containing protein [Marinobacter mobilis]SDX07927.1 cell division inhibitor SulA [Marinobacter mobilis]
MEQLSFNQNLACAQPVSGFARASRPAGERVVGSVSVKPAVGRTPQVTRRHDQGDAGTGAGNVTEIILPEGQVENFQLLLPMLTQLNQEKRWLALIDPPAALVSRWQTMHGIVASELLVLRSTAEYSTQALAERALSAGTCHAVVMWTSKLGKGAFDALRESSALGNSHGVVLRQR